MNWPDLDFTEGYSIMEDVETMWLREKLYNVEKLNTCSLPFLLSAAKDISLLRQQENDTSKSFESILMHLSDIVIEIDNSRNAKEFDVSNEMDLYSKSLTCDGEVLEKIIDLMKQLSKEKEISNIAKNLLIDIYRNKDNICQENNDISSEENLNNSDILTIINIMKDKIFNTIKLINDKDEILNEKDVEIMKLNKELENIRSQFYQNELLNKSNQKLIDDFKINENLDIMQRINDENVILKETIKNFEIQMKELKEESENNLSEKHYIQQELEIVTKQFQRIEKENISNKTCIEDFKIKYDNVEQLEQKVVALSEDLESQIDDYFTLQTQVNKFNENEESYKALLRKLISKSSENFVEDKSVQELVQILENIILDFKSPQNESDSINNPKIGSTDEIVLNSTLHNESSEYQIENLIRELEKSKETNEIYVTELRDKNAKMDEMSLEIEIISQKLQQSVDLQQSLRNSFESTKEQDEKIIEELKNEICTFKEAMKNLIEENENEIKIKLSLIESNEKTILELNDEINILHEKYQNLTNEKFNNENEFENRTKTLELELEEEKMKTMSLKLKEEEVLGLLTENKSLEFKYENLIKTKDEIQSKLESSLEDYLKLSEELVLIKAQKIEAEKNFDKYELETNNSLAEKSDMIKELDLTVQNLHTEIEVMESKYKSEINDLEVKLKNLVYTVDKLSDEMENINIIKETLANENRELEIKIELSQINLNELAAKERHLTLEMKDKEKDYLEQFQEANSEIASQQALMKDLTEENVNLISKLNISMEMIEDFKTNLNSLIEERDYLKMEINNKEDIVKEISRNLDTIVEEKLTISKNLFLTEEKLKEFKGDNEVIGCRLVELESSLEIYKIDLMTTLSEKKTAEEELKIYQRSLNEKENLIITLNNDFENSTKLIENLKTKLCNTTDEINQLNSLIETIRNDKELESLKSDLINKEEQVKKCEHQSLLYSNELMTVKRENDMWTHKYNETHQELQNAKKKFKKEISNLKNQHEMLELQLIELKSRSNDEEIAKLKLTIDDLNKQVESQKKQIDEFDSLHHHYNELKDRYLEKRKLIKQQKDEIQTLNGKIKQMVKELQECKSVMRSN